MSIGCQLHATVLATCQRNKDTQIQILCQTIALLGAKSSHGSPSYLESKSPNSHDLPLLGSLISHPLFFSHAGLFTAPRTSCNRFSVLLKQVTLIEELQIHLFPRSSGGQKSEANIQGQVLSEGSRENLCHAFLLASGDSWQSRTFLGLWTHH